MSELELIVGGRRYGGWRSIRVTRSIESICGQFDVEAADRWADQEEPWPIVEEDPCRVEIDGEVVIDGYVDKRRPRLSGNALSLSYDGRDRAGALVDCSALLKQWSFKGATVLDIARKVCEPFAIPVSIQPGLTLPKAQKKQVVTPGDSPFEIMHVAAKAAEVLIVSDAKGGIVITRAGSKRAPTALVQGENVLEAEIDYDATERFSRYIVATQTGGESYFTSAADVESVTKIFAEATDVGVRRKNRVLIIRPETGLTKEYARRRGDWEARVRAARAETATVTVIGWRQPGGELWPLNALVSVRIPRIGINGVMLISEVTHVLGSGGKKTALRLVRPDAFTPEPQAKVGSTGRWKEIADGGL